MVSIGHIAMSLSEIFNHFYSSLRLSMMYSKKFVVFARHKYLFVEISQKVEFFSSVPLNYSTPVTQDFSSSKRHHFKDLLRHKSCSWSFMSKLTVCLWYAVCVLFFQALSAERKAFLCWTVWLSSEMVFCEYDNNANS